MRAIEAEINKRRGEADRRSEIPLTNFRGIELRDFPAEIARLALIIAEYQCDVLYRGQKEALRDFLPLDAENWITCGNALRLDWLSICPPTGKGVKMHGDDLFRYARSISPEIDFENEGGETYIQRKPALSWIDPGRRLIRSLICKPYSAMLPTAGNRSTTSLVWFMKAADYGTNTNAAAAFVSTNSILPRAAGADLMAADLPKLGTRSPSPTLVSNGLILPAIKPELR